MLVHEILNTEIAPLRDSDTVSLALTKLDLLHINKFVVVNSEDEVKGMVEIETLAEVLDESTLISELPLGDPIWVPSTQHLFETTRQMVAHELYVLPVADRNMKYLGLVRKREVLNALGDIFNLATYGSVITIELSQMDYTLSDIVRIIETEGAKILGVAVQQPSERHNSIRVSIKLNLEDSSVVSAALRRFGYVILSEEQSESLEHNFSDRADELIRYLDI
ncbi:CBS domain-containing protein [Balneola vulgaris]|jgi:predicted transcriptional regulator|uniref:CBS domain-containing protein n=1 Tax=Balneola vulgaris TaxID=287535 RepID=UPI000366D728|nr:CBS domain-containing protein [Balneola vulgaris]